ncbi:MAG: nucleotidyl transferase AbiEii/AbiGii toxin family protein [Mycobacteriales bacterium]
MQLYVLESFLARLASSRFADQLVLKGGVLLAAFGERRPTRDVDLQAEALDNDAANVRTVICEVANLRLDDGVAFDVDGATAAVIRDEDAYSGVRVWSSRAARRRRSPAGERVPVLRVPRHRPATRRSPATGAADAVHAGANHCDAPCQHDQTRSRSLS